MKNPDNKTLFKIALTAVITCLTVIYFSKIIGFITLVINVCFPLILGAVFAFVIDIPLRRLETLYFPKSKNPWVQRSRRPVCIILALLLMIVMFLLIVLIVIPEMASCFEFIIHVFPPLFEQGRLWLSDAFANIPALQEALNSLNIDWQSLFSSILSTFVTGAGGALSSVMEVVLGIVNGFIQTFIAFIFAVYILANKEKLKRQSSALFRAYLKPAWMERIVSVLKLSNATFSKYFAGQLIEALIFGLLCFIGMLIFRFPYPLTISILIGVTALIPLVGAFIGAILGALMILTVSPWQMLFFLIFIIVLQQIEGNLIFPRVVGSAISLPGLWTLTAVTLGGGLMGILGIFICVPATSVIYQLLRKNVSRRLAQDE